MIEVLFLPLCNYCGLDIDRWKLPANFIVHLKVVHHLV